MFLPTDNVDITENEVDPNHRPLVPNYNMQGEAAVDGNVEVLDFDEADFDASSHTPSEHFHNHSYSDSHDVIHVASWQWDYVRTPFIYTAVVIVAGFCKIGL